MRIQMATSSFRITNMEKFITAEQARYLVDESDAGIDYILKDIDKNIRDAARKGERVLVSYALHAWLSRPLTDLFVKPNDVQLKVMKFLRKYNYSVEFNTHGDSYVPKGLADDFGMGPKYINWCIHIRW